MAEKQYPIRIDMRAAGGPKAAPRKEPTAADIASAAAVNGALSFLGQQGRSSLTGLAALKIYDMMKGSGGQMPETAKPKGAPKAKPEVPGKAAASVYDSMNSAWLQNLAKGGPISVNAMRGIAQTVPTPVPPLGVEDTIRADQYALLQAAYGPVIQQAQAAKDQEAFTTAYDEYAKRAALLMGVDPLQLQMLQAE